jgi:hypothetical protein
MRTPVLLMPSAGAFRPFWPVRPGRAGDLPAGIEIAGQGGPQFLGVVCTQVDLVVRAVQPEKDCAFCFVCGCRNPVTLCDLGVFTDQAAESLSPQHADIHAY